VTIIQVCVESQTDQKQTVEYTEAAENDLNMEIRMSESW